MAPISHWAGAPSTGLLLMEPLLPGRGDIKGEMRDAFPKVSAYRLLLASESDADWARHTRLCVYLLPGGRPEQRAEIASVFLDQKAADVVIDTASEERRSRFVDEIRRYGERGAAQGSLPPSGN